MINLRNALMSGKRKPTAADYQTADSKLGFVFDAIENTAWGTHTSAPTTWSDLLGRWNMSISSSSHTVLWGADRFSFNGSCYFQNAATRSSNLLKSLGNSWTIFAVFRPKAQALATGQTPKGVFGNTDEGSGYGLQCPQFNMWNANEHDLVFGNYPHGGTPNGIAFSSSLLTADGFYSFALVGTPTSYKLYMNGALFTTDTPGNQNNTTMSKAPCYLGATQTSRRCICDVHNVRGYTRELTASEILAFSNIDKARFDP